MKKIVSTIGVLFLMLLSLQAQNDLIISKGTLDTDKVRPPQIDLSKIVAKAPVTLNEYFKADDGSIICIRQIKDKVYAIADRMDRRFSSVWVGEIVGKTLKINYYYIPKGQAKGNGKAEFIISGSRPAQKLILKNPTSNKLKKGSLNIKSLNSVSKLSGRLPINDRAWYRGNTLNNLTGRWKIDNVGQDYVLDLGNQVLIYSVGGRTNANARPQFTCLFIGDRIGNDLKGFYVDLPLGHTFGFGNAAFKVIGPHYIRANYDHFYYGVNRERIKEDKREIIQ